MQIAQKDNKTAQEIKVELQAQIQENERLRESIQELERKVVFYEAKDNDVMVSSVIVADNSTPPPVKESVPTSSQEIVVILDAIIAKEDCIGFKDQNLVGQVLDRVTTLKTQLSQDQEKQREALI